MIERKIAGQYNVEFNIRPPKLVYFIRHDDVETLKRVFSLACTQWGGIRHLVVPVASDVSMAPIFTYMIQSQEPDLFISYLMDIRGNGREDNDKLAQKMRTIFPNRNINLQIGSYFEKHDETIHALSVIAEMEREQHALNHYQLSNDELLSRALYGAIYEGQEEVYNKRLLINKHLIDQQSEDFWQSQFVGTPFSSLINLTGYGINLRSATNVFIPADEFYIVLVNDFIDLCVYWNLRAIRENFHVKDEDFGRRILLLPTEFLQDSTLIERLLQFVKAKLPYPGRSSNINIYFSVGHDDLIQRLKESLSTIPVIEHFTGRQSINFETGRKGQGPKLIEKLTYRIQPPDLPDSYSVGVAYIVPTQTPLDYGRNQVLLDPPPRYINSFLGTVGLDISSDVWKRYLKNGYIADAIKRGAWFSRDGLSMLIPLHPRPQYIDFSLPTQFENLQLFFETKGYQIQQSAVSQYSDAVINLIGGLDNVGILATTESYLLLDILALKSTKKIAQRISNELRIREDRIDEIQQVLNDFEIIPELKGIPKSYRALYSDSRLQPYKASLLDTLAQLTDSGVLRRGFYLNCPNCGAPEWYMLQSLAERLVCSGCSHTFLLPVKQGNSEIQWQYRLNTLVNRAVDQDVLPGILAFHYASKDLQPALVGFGLEVLQSDKVITDFDFLFIADEKLYGGECKAGTELRDKDLDTARLAAKLGFHIFYFCTTQEAFREETEVKIKVLKQELVADGIDMAIEVLSGRELIGQPL